MNATTEMSNSTEKRPLDLLEIFGPKNPYFKLIHYTALVCLFTSISISIYTLIFLMRSGNGNIFSEKNR